MTPNKLPPLSELIAEGSAMADALRCSLHTKASRVMFELVATVEALRQSQSLPAGAVADGIRKLSLSDYLRIEAERVEDPGLKDRLRKFSNIAEQQEAIPASELRDSFRWNALLNRIDTASAKEFGTLLNIIGDARAMGCECLENYVDQIDVGEFK